MFEKQNKHFSQYHWQCNQLHEHRGCRVLGETKAGTSSMIIILEVCQIKSERLAASLCNGLCNCRHLLLRLISLRWMSTSSSAARNSAFLNRTTCNDTRHGITTWAPLHAGTFFSFCYAIAIRWRPFRCCHA